MSSRGKLYNTDRVTDPARRAFYERLEAEGVCQFCEEGVRRGYIAPIHIFEHWYVVTCDPPYGGATHHWMAIAKNHHICLEDRGAGDELFYIRELFMSENDLSSCCMVQRKGEMSRTCASVAHDHVHLTAAMEGTLGDKTFQMDLGYWPKS